MKAVILSAILATGLCSSLYAGESPTTRPADPAQVQALIGDLSSDDWKTRESATDKLSQMGPEIVPALQEAAKSKDLETKTRAQQIITRMEGAKDGHKTTRRKLTEEERGAAQPGQWTVQGRGARVMSNSVRVSSVNGKKTVDIEENGQRTHIDFGDKIVAQLISRTDDEEVTEIYEASNPEDFQKKYPEIYPKIGPYLGDDFNMAHGAIRIQGNVQIHAGQIVMPGQVMPGQIVVPGGAVAPLLPNGGAGVVGGASAAAAAVAIPPGAGGADIVIVPGPDGVPEIRTKPPATQP